MLVVRPETPADFGEIAAVVEAAFGESASAFARLRNLISIRRIRRFLTKRSWPCR
jgi:predicted N-acetyltransferase YhbS